MTAKLSRAVVSFRSEIGAHQANNGFRIVGLLSILRNPIHLLHPACSASMNHLPSLLRLTNRNSIHYSAARARPIPRQDIHVERSQTKGTVIPVRTVGERPHVLLASDAPEAPVFLASSQGPNSFTSKTSRWKEPGSVCSSLNGSRLASTRGKFTAGLSSQRLLPVPASSGPVSSPNPDLDRFFFTVPATSGALPPATGMRMSRLTGAGVVPG
jgi:hypothetical protein